MDVLYCHGEAIGFMAVKEEHYGMLVQRYGVIAWEVPSTVQSGPIYHGLRLPREWVFLVIRWVNRVSFIVCPND